MKIAFISSRFPPDFIGGGELSTATIASGLVKIGHEVHVYCGASEDKEEQKEGVFVHRRKDLIGLWAKPLFEKKSSRKLASVLKKLLAGYDIVHAHDFRSALALSETGVANAFVTIRDYAPICGTTNNMWKDGKSCDGCSWKNVTFRCHRVVEASLSRKLFRIWQYKYNLNFRKSSYDKLPWQVFISESLRAQISLRRKVLPKSRVIYNPVSEMWLSPITDFVNEQRVVYVGTVESYKGVSILLQAFSKIANKFPKAKLDIVGLGHDLEEYKKFVDELGLEKQIFFQGKKSQEETMRFVDKSLAVVQPSVWEEPFGRTVLEAYARGRAVIATRVGGIKETFQDGTGFLVSPSVDEIAECLSKIFSDLESTHKMGLTGRKYVEQNFTSEKIASEYEKFYETVS